MFHDFYDKNWRIFQSMFLSLLLFAFSKKKKWEKRKIFLYTIWQKTQIKNRIVSFFDLSDLKGIFPARGKMVGVYESSLLCRAAEKFRAREFQTSIFPSSFPSTSFFTYGKQMRNVERSEDWIRRRFKMLGMKSARKHRIVNKPSISPGTKFSRLSSKRVNKRWP